MKISEAKDILSKDQLCWYEGLLDRCREGSCDNCIYYVNPTIVQDAIDTLRDYYIKKHVKAQKKDFMLEVQEARLRKKVE